MSQVRELLEPSSLPGVHPGSRSSSRQRSGLVTPDSELADEEVDRLGQQAAHDDALGDGERALVHAMCNVSRSMKEAHRFAHSYLYLGGMEETRRGPVTLN